MGFGGVRWKQIEAGEGGLVRRWSLCVAGIGFGVYAKYDN